MTSKMMVNVRDVPFDNPIVIRFEYHSSKDIQEIKKFCSENIQASWGFSNSVYIDWNLGQHIVYFFFSEESDLMVLKLFSKNTFKRIYMWPDGLKLTFKLYGADAEKICQ